MKKSTTGAEPRLLDVVKINPDAEIMTPVHCFPAVTSRTTDGWADSMPSNRVGGGVGVAVGAGVGVGRGVGVEVGVGVGAGVGVFVGVGVGGTAVSVGVGGTTEVGVAGVAHAATNTNSPTTAGARKASRRWIMLSASR